MIQRNKPLTLGQAIDACLAGQRVMVTRIHKSDRHTTHTTHMALRYEPAYPRGWHLTVFGGSRSYTPDFPFPIDIWQGYTLLFAEEIHDDPV